VTISSNERWFLSQLVFDGHVFLSNYRGFWMFAPTSGQVSSSMCQYGVGNKWHRKPSSFNFVCIL